MIYVTGISLEFGEVQLIRSLQKWHITQCQREKNYPPFGNGLLKER